MIVYQILSAFVRYFPPHFYVLIGFNHLILFVKLYKNIGRLIVLKKICGLKIDIKVKVAFCVRAIEFKCQFSGTSIFWRPQPPRRLGAPQNTARLGRGPKGRTSADSLGQDHWRHCPWALLGLDTAALQRSASSRELAGERIPGLDAAETLAYSFSIHIKSDFLDACCLPFVFHQAEYLPLLRFQ